MKSLRNYFGGWRNVRNISIGLCYVLFNLWVMLHLPDFFPSDQQTYWFKFMVSYLLLNVFVISNAGLRNKLFNIRLLDFLPRFVFFFAVFLAIFYFLLGWLEPLPSSFTHLLGSVPIWLAMIHGFTVAVTESVVWQGYLDEQLGHPWSELSAGAFHLFVWSGQAFFVILGAGLLFALFSIVNYFYRINKDDLAPAIGVHTAYNYMKLALVYASGLVVAL
jgi:hypothetical protein